MRLEPRFRIPNVSERIVVILITFQEGVRVHPIHHLVARDFRLKFGAGNARDERLSQ